MRQRLTALLTLLAVAAGSGCSTTGILVMAPRDPVVSAENDYRRVEYCGDEFYVAPVIDTALAAGAIGLTISVATGCPPSGCGAVGGMTIPMMGLIGLGFAYSAYLGFRWPPICKKIVACYRGDAPACQEVGLNPDGSKPLVNPVRSDPTRETQSPAEASPG